MKLSESGDCTMARQKNREILNIRFNQDYGCFSCAMESGFRIYNVNPLVQKLRCAQAQVGSVAMVEMLHRSNLFAIVGGGSNPKYAEYSVLVMDDSKKQIEQKIIFEISFSQPVLAVRLKQERLIAVLRNEIHVFSFPNQPTKLFSVDTRDNPRGLCEVCSSLENHLLVFPGYKCGTLQFIDMSVTERSQSAAPNQLVCHQSELAALAMNQQGTLVATASKKGTLIRVFSLQSKRLTTELRRGSDTALTYCIAFSPDSSFLCVSSDKGTIHIFAIRDTNLNKRSSLKKIGFLGQYVESQWGLASFTVPAECSCVCAFGPSNTVVAVCVDGTFHKYAFTPEGACNRDSYDVFLDLEDESAEF